MYQGTQILPLATQLTLLGCIGWGYYNIANNSNYMPWEFLSTSATLLGAFVWKIFQNILEQIETKKQHPYATLNEKLQNAVPASQLPEIAGIKTEIDKLKAIESSPDAAQSTLISAKSETGNFLLQSVAKAFYSNARLSNGYAIDLIDVQDYIQATAVTGFAPKKLDTEKLLSDLTSKMEKLEQLGSQSRSGGHYFLFLNRIDLVVDGTKCTLTNKGDQQTILATLRQCMQNHSCTIIATSASENKNISDYLKKMFTTQIDLIGSAVDPEDRRLSEEEQKKKKEEFDKSERELMTPEIRRALLKLVMPTNTATTDIESLVGKTRALSLDELIATAQLQRTLELNKPHNHPKPQNKHERDYRYFINKDDLAMYDARTKAQVAKQVDAAIADGSFVAELPTPNTKTKKPTAQEQEYAGLEREIKTTEELLNDEQQKLEKLMGQAQANAEHTDSIFGATPQDFERSIKVSQERIAYLDNELQQKREALKKLSAEVPTKQTAQITDKPALPANQYDQADCYYHGIGVAVDKKRAVELYRLCAQAGDAKAQCKLGYCYQMGEGVDTDKEQAFKLYTESANQGWALGQCNLGYCYQIGEGVGANKKRAVELYQLAANQGLALARYNLGCCYLRGEGVKKDLTKAIQYFQHAALQNNSLAKQALLTIPQITADDFSKQPASKPLLTLQQQKALYDFDQSCNSLLARTSNEKQPSLLAKIAEHREQLLASFKSTGNPLAPRAILRNRNIACSGNAQTSAGSAPAISSSSTSSASSNAFSSSSSSATSQFAQAAASARS